MSPAWFVKLGLLGSLLAIFPTKALAIPAFARKYRASCSTCHIAYPALNSFGKAFKARGYRLPAEEKFIKDDPVSLGAPAWKQVFPSPMNSTACTPPPSPRPCRGPFSSTTIAVTSSM